MSLNTGGSKSQSRLVRKMGSCIGSICFTGTVKGSSVGNGVLSFLSILHNWVLLNGD